jgi:hypothetical protein
MNRNIFIAILGILFSQFSQAQKIDIKPPTPLDVGNLKNFPATQILNVIESLQTDLQRCETLNARIIQNERQTNKTLTFKLTETQTLLSRSETRADSLSIALSNINTVSISAKSDIKKLKWLKYLDRFLTIAAASVATYYGTKK